MRRVWKISLLVITCITLIIVINNFTGDSMPDGLTRILGVLDMAAIVVLVYTSIKLRK
jgi:hypothetical protein